MQAKMNITEHKQVLEKFKSRTCCNFYLNNERLGVIVPVLLENKLEDHYNDILKYSDTTIGFYELRAISNEIEMKDPEKIVNIIIDTISKKLDLLYESINVESSPINIDVYTQIWTEYKNFSEKLYLMIKNHQYFMVEKNIKIGKITHDILGIIQLCMFYDKIISKSNILTDISSEIININKKNVEHLIGYIDSVRSFMLMKEFTKVDFDKLFKIIKNIMEETNIVNICCLYVDNLLKQIKNNFNAKDPQTVEAGQHEKDTIKKIYKIISILATYSNKQKLMICHQKFLQARIVNLSYNNLELEIEIIRRMSGALGSDNSQTLIDIVIDIINTKEINKAIQKAEIKQKSDLYKGLEINPSIIDSIIINKRIWNISNISDMNINYPPEIQCYLDTITKSYGTIHDNKYSINWQPVTSSIKVETAFGSKKVAIKCNMLQCTLLIYLGKHSQTTVEQFSDDTGIFKELASKIFESMIETDLIELSPDHKYYKINTKYAGSLNIDTRKNFIDIFK